jgi:hypothetical protein
VKSQGNAAFLCVKCPDITGKGHFPLLMFVKKKGTDLRVAYYRNVSYWWESN